MKRTALVVSFLSVTAAAWAQTPPAATETRETRERRAAPTPEQMEKRRAEMKQRFEAEFKKADSDGDGALSKAEAEKSMPRLAKDFDAIDTNKDGKLTQDEIRTHMEARMAERHKSMQGKGAPSPEQMEKRRAEMKQRFDAEFKKADTDGDGALSKAEAEKSMPRLAKNFDAVDTNKDGKLTQDEIRSHMQARMAEHHKGSPGGMGPGGMGHGGTGPGKGDAPKPQ